MGNQERPEQLPEAVAPPKSFRFTLGFISEAERKNTELLSNCNIRIEKLSKGCTLSSMEVIPELLRLSHDKDELKTLAKGLDRIADIVDALSELERREVCLKYAEENPTWFASAFADLEYEVNNSIPDDIDITELL